MVRGDDGGGPGGPGGRARERRKQFLDERGLAGADDVEDQPDADDVTMGDPQAVACGEEDGEEG